MPDAEGRAAIIETSPYTDQHHNRVYLNPCAEQEEDAGSGARDLRRAGRPRCAFSTGRRGSRSCHSSSGSSQDARTVPTAPA